MPTFKSKRPLHTGSLSIVLRCEATASVETVANNIVFMIE